MTPHPRANPPRLVRFELSFQSVCSVISALLALWLIGRLVPVIVVIVGALILAGTVNPFVTWLERRHIKRPWAIACVFGAGVLAAGLLAVVIVPALWSQIAHMMERLPELQARAVEMLSQHPLTSPLAGVVKQVGAPHQVPTKENLDSAVAMSLGVVAWIGYAATSVVLGIYFIADYERMRGLLFAFVPRTYHIRLARILMNLEPIVGGYMRGQVITSLAITVFAFGLLTVCHVPSALPLAAFAGLTDVIPFIGGLLATTPAVLLALTHGVPTAAVVLAAMLAYQEFESRIIVPRVYGRALRLPPATVVVALLVGGKLGGIIGALLALPLAAALRMIIEELRFELPGDDKDDSALRRRDEKAEREYVKESTGTTPVEAAEIAAKIVHHVHPESPLKDA